MYMSNVKNDASVVISYSSTCVYTHLFIHSVQFIFYIHIIDPATVILSSWTTSIQMFNEHYFS